MALYVLLSYEGLPAVVWISYIAPYAAIYTRAENSPSKWLRDEDFVFWGSSADGRLERVRSVLESAGLWVLPPWLLRQEMHFYSVNDAEVQRMPMFRVFFTDLDDLFPFEDV